MCWGGFGGSSTVERTHPLALSEVEQCYTTVHALVGKHKIIVSVYSPHGMLHTCEAYPQLYIQQYNIVIARLPSKNTAVHQLDIGSASLSNFRFTSQCSHLN